LIKASTFQWYLTATAVDMGIYSGWKKKKKEKKKKHGNFVSSSCRIS